MRFKADKKNISIIKNFAYFSDSQNYEEIIKYFFSEETQNELKFYKISSLFSEKLSISAQKNDKKDPFAMSIEK